jgi:hypothetical protein
MHKEFMQAWREAEIERPHIPHISFSQLFRDDGRLVAATMFESWT